MNITAPKLASGPRFDHQLSTPQLSTTAPERRKSRELKFHSITLHYQEYRNARGRYYLLFYHDAGGRHRESRSTFAALKRRAAQVALNIANGQTAMNQFSEADRASCQRALELLAPTGLALESAAALLAEVCALLRPLQHSSFNLHPSLHSAIQFYLENRPRDFTPLPLPDLVEAFLADKSAGICPAWHGALAQQVRRLAKWSNRPLHCLTAQDLNAWLRSLAIGGRTRANYRAGVEQLVRWAQTNHHVPRTWSEMARVAHPAQRQVEVKILTPGEVVRLLRVREYTEAVGRGHAGLVQLLALQAFAGLRHVEANRLDWRDVHLDERHIYINAKIAKTHCDRVVPISDNLAAWLASGLRPSGPICPMTQTSGALTKAKKAAGLPAGRNESRNILRKSFISYRLAVTQNIAQVAEEAGNSPSVIRSNYKRPIPQAEGQRWFNLWPTAADVIQLQFSGL